MASPQVAGALAVVWDAFPNLTPDELVKLLKDSTDPLPALDGVDRFGEVPGPGPHVSDDLSERHVMIVESRTRQRVDPSTAIALPACNYSLVSKKTGDTANR